MAYIKKEIREKVWDKYERKCAYCGKPLEYKQMQVDHIYPAWHNWSDNDKEFHGIKSGEHSIENYNPSCARCNRWKSTFTVEGFREQIAKQCERLRRDSNQYNMAIDYGLITETQIQVEFWFEKYNKSNNCN